MAASRCTRSVISSTTSGRSSGGSPMDQDRYALWLHVGQSSDRSARTRGGFSSPGSEYDVSHETSPEEHVDLEALFDRLALQAGRPRAWRGSG